jgi:hypothetical protein
MPKSRGRKPGRAARRRNQPGDPRHRAALAEARLLAGPAAQARARLARLLSFGDAADPLQVISVLPRYMDVIVAEAAGAIEEERCADDCVILACAYAHLGVTAEIRAATLTVTDTRDRSSTAHGTLAPCWEDGLLRGHTVVWIPAQGCLIDSTILQFLPEDSLSWEAVIARASGSQPADTVTASHGRFRLAYTLAPAQATAPVLAYPRMLHERDDLLRRGMNIASAALALMAEHLPAERAAQIPHPRAAALLTATRDLPATQTPAGDWRYTAPAPAPSPPASPSPRSRSRPELGCLLLSGLRILI